MSRNDSLSRRASPVWSGVLLSILALLSNVDLAQAQYYRVGQIVNPTNFTLYTRRPWTNLTGRGFSQGAPVRLTDFAGYVVFFEFFDPT